MVSLSTHRKQNVDKKILDDLANDMNRKIEGISYKIEETYANIVALEKHEIEGIQRLKRIFEINISTLRNFLAEKD